MTIENTFCSTLFQTGRDNVLCCCPCFVSVWVQWVQNWEMSYQGFCLPKSSRELVISGKITETKGLKISSIIWKIKDGKLLVCMQNLSALCECQCPRLYHMSSWLLEVPGYASAKLLTQLLSTIDNYGSKLIIYKFWKMLADYACFICLTFCMAIQSNPSLHWKKCLIFKDEMLQKKIMNSFVVIETIPLSCSRNQRAFICYLIFDNSVRFMNSDKDCFLAKS